MPGRYSALFSCSLGIRNCSRFHHLFGSRINTVFTIALFCGHVVRGFAYFRLRRTISSTRNRPSPPVGITPVTTRRGVVTFHNDRSTLD